MINIPYLQEHVSIKSEFPSAEKKNIIIKHDLTEETFKYKEIFYTYEIFANKSQLFCNI